MSDLYITYQDYKTNKPFTRQFSGDVVGVRETESYTIVGCARKVTKQGTDIGDGEPYDYEEMEPVEEFHIRTGSVYDVTITHGPYAPVGSEAHAARVAEVQSVASPEPEGETPAEEE